jgi:hypothetical protein
MTIAVVITLMGIMIAIAKNRQSIGMKEYFIIFLITVIQVTFLVYIFFTMEQPPVY